ncbi:MAG: carboxypeptidase regulatory-like domain-containing protein [Acidobacteriota bacterium]
MAPAPTDPAPTNPPSTATYTLSGTVSARAAGSAPLPAAAPIAAAKIEIVSGTNSGRSVASDAAGHYLLEGLAAGPFAAKASAAGYVARTIDVTFTADQVADFTLLTVPGPSDPPVVTYTLSGTITDAAIGPSSGVAAARVEVIAGPNSGHSVVTGDDGRFELPGLESGSLSAKVSAVGFVTQTASMTLSANQSLDVALVPAFATKGRAIDALTQLPIAGISISGGPGVSGASDAAGGFVILVETTPVDGASVVFSGSGVVEHRTVITVPGPDVTMPLIPSSFDLRAFDEMFRAPILLRWRTAPPLQIEIRTMQFTSKDATQATALTDQMSDADAAAMTSDLTWALPQLTAGTFTNFAGATRGRAVAGSTTSLLTPGRITVFRFKGLSQATGVWGYTRWQFSSDGTVTGGVIMLDRDFDASASPYVRSLRAHELGHALGYNHVTVRTSVMNVSAQTEPNQFDRDAAKIAFQREPGNKTPDIDPSASLAMPQAIGTGTWSPPVQ